MGIHSFLTKVFYKLVLPLVELTIYRLRKHEDIAENKPNSITQTQTQTQTQTPERSEPPPGAQNVNVHIYNMCTPEVEGARVQHHDSKLPLNISVQRYTGVNSPETPRRPTRPSSTPQPSPNSRPLPYNRVPLVDLSSVNAPQLPRQQSKIKDKEAFVYWYEARCVQKLESPPVVMLQNAAEGEFFVLWTNETTSHCWRYCAGDGGWKKMKWGLVLNSHEECSEEQSAEDPRYFVVSPNQGVPSFVTKSTYKRRYGDK